MEWEILKIVLAGAIGALAKDIFQDNKLILPKIENGNFYLGFLGGMAIGAFTGYAIDGSVITAAMAGFTGSSIISNLGTAVNKIKESKNVDIENLIRTIAKQEIVDPDLAVRVAKCESNLDPEAEHFNKDGSADRGVFQINDKWHPEVSDEQAFDVAFSTKFFCTAFKAGHLDWWDASKKCWDISPKIS